MFLMFPHCGIQRVPAPDLPSGAEGLDLVHPVDKKTADHGRRTKKKDIYVISTPKRPVPLEHFLWAGRDLHKIVDSKSKFVGEG